MSATERVLIRELSREECTAILGRNHVGRLAYTRGNQIDIEPVHYVYEEPWLYGRTSEGRKLEMTGYTWWPVAFEVDEVDGVFRWRSVVVHGGFYTIPPRGSHWEEDAWAHGVELLRGLVPATLQEGDPFPHRVIVFRVSVQEVSGREASAEMPVGPAGEVAERPSRAAAPTT